MERKTLYSQVHDLIEARDDLDTLVAKKLDEADRERLAATYMRNLGKEAYEVFDNALSELAGKILIALEANPEERKEMAIDILNYLLMMATEHTEKPVNDCIDDAIGQIRLTEQFESERSRVITLSLDMYADNKERARDMSLTLKGY